MKQIAIQFGESLDKDDFEHTKTLLSDDCQYLIGEDLLVGPESICRSYEENMLEGRKKLDVLEWGQSSIESIGNSQFYVHFTDYLTHKGLKHTHRCKQKLWINESHLITRIEHIHNQTEQDELDAYYRKVDLK